MNFLFEFGIANLDGLATSGLLLLENVSRVLS